MTIFTKTAVIKALEEIVAEVGADYVYPKAESYQGCVYAEDGAASCIAGRVIAKLDPESFAKVAELEKKYGSWGAEDFNGVISIADDAEGKAVYAPKLDATKAGLAALGAAQWQQDRAAQYGTALEAAKESRA